MKFQADTIIYDANKIAEYQNNSQYDYNSQLDLPDYSLLQMLSRWFNRLLNTIFGGKFEEHVTTPVLITLVVIAIAAIIYFLYKKRPELFLRTKKNETVPYSVEEENIHEIDFNKEISLALENGDYRLATRLLYLQTLRILSDNNLIDWQIHKTPTEYLYEVTNINLKPKFRQLTNHFLEVRYGNYNATHELYLTMLDIQSEMTTSMESSGNATATSVTNDPLSESFSTKIAEGGANEG